jgi:DNA sulfur modification protein DndB
MASETLVSQMVVENVIRSKMRGKVIYQGNISSSNILKLFYVKPYYDPSGKGYQRPVNKKRCKDFSTYLSNGEEALFTPILMNAGGEWEFVSYDSFRPSFGRLICKKRASLMDGQHRLGGIKIYTEETSAQINVPFLAFHWLDEDEEIKLFDTINTKAKGIGTSLSRYLKRDSEELSWIATQLIINKESPFNHIGTIIGQRSRGKHITLQNLYNALELLTKGDCLANLSKEKKLIITQEYFGTLKEMFAEEWEDYRSSKLTHIVCVNALSMVGNRLLKKCFSRENKTLDKRLMARYLKRISKVDWSVNGSMKYLIGKSGSKTLSEDLINQMKLEKQVS